jgi:putative endonuclease
MVKGARGEAIAVTWLEARGWRVLGRNVRYRCGELDVVAWDGAQVVFVEVRSRRDRRVIPAAQSVTWGKQRRVLRAALRWLQQHGDASMSARFDVIGVDLARAAVVSWLPGAFEAGEAQLPSPS